MFCESGDGSQQLFYWHNEAAVVKSPKGATEGDFFEIDVSLKQETNNSKKN